MSKRGAENQLTKDQDTYEPRPPANPTRIPRQATAAQLAARKLKAPKGRMTNTPQSGNAFPAFNNLAPNGSANIQQPQQSQGFGSVNSGTPFGQSASFPPTNTGSGLQFTPSTTSFSFGSQATNNPFAGTAFGQAASAVASNAGSTSALNYGRSSELQAHLKKNLRGTYYLAEETASAPLLKDIPMESPPKQGTSQFGGTSQPSVFGAPTTSQPRPPTQLFGQTQSAAPSSNIFGFGAQNTGPQSSTFAQSAPSTQPSNFFGKTQPAAQPSNTFGQASSTSQPSTAFNSQTSNLFAQASSTSQPSTASTSQPSNMFGAPSLTSQPSSVSTGQPASMFAQTPSNSQPVNGPGLSLAAPRSNFFGTSTSTSQPLNGIGASTAGQTSNLFSQSTSTSQAPHTFGQSTATSQQSTLFGKPTATPQPTMPFAQSPAFTPTPASGLGQSSAAPTSGNEPFGGASSAISALTGVSSGPSQSETDALAAQAPKSTPFTNVFSKSADTPARSDAPNASLTHTSNFGLGAPTTQTPSNLFGVAPTARPTAETSTSAPNMFAASTTSAPGQTQAPTTTTTTTPAASTATQAFNPFGFAPTPNPVSPLFGRKSQAGSGSLFDRIKPPTAESAQQIPHQTSVEAAQSVQGQNSNPGGLFARVSAPAQTPAQTVGQQPAQEPERSISPKNNSRPAVEAASANSAAMLPQQQPAASQTSNLFSNLYANKDEAAGANKGPVRSHSELPQPSEESSMSGKPPAAAQAPPTAATATPASETSNPRCPPPAKSDASAKTATFKMRSHTMEKPSDLEEYDIQDFDVLARAKGLNVSFQKYIAGVDTSKQDLMPAVLFFLAQRERLGAPVELLEMIHKSGTKRKVDDADGAQETQKASKRARTEPETVHTTDPSQVYAQGANPSSSTTPHANGPEASSTTSNIFKSVLSSSAQAPSHPAASGVTSSEVGNSTPTNPFSNLKTFTPSAVQSPNVFTAQHTSGSESPQSKTTQASPHSSNLFQSMTAPTPSTFPQQPAASQPASLFQYPSAPSPSPFAQQQGAPQTTNFFKPQIESTTPNKSPPKKPKFEMPKFGGSSGTNFMDAFAKQSATSAADLEAEAKRKRKAEEFDSDEDNEEEWELKDAEKQRMKRAKLEALTRAGSGGFQPIFDSKEALQAQAPVLPSADASNYVLAPTVSKNEVLMGLSDVAVPIPTPVGRPVYNDISDDESDGFVDEDRATGRDQDQTLEHDGDYEESSDEDSSSRDSDEDEGEEDLQADAAQLGENDEESEDDDDDDDDEAYVEDILAKNRAVAKAQAQAQSSGSPSIFDRITGPPAEEVVDEEEEPYIQDILAQNKAAAQASAGLSLFDRITAPPSKEAGAEDDSQANEAGGQKPSTNGFKSHGLDSTSTPATTRGPFNRSFKAPATNGILNSGTSSFTPKAPTMSPFTPVDGVQSGNASSFIPKAPTMSPFTPINGAQATPFSAGASVFGTTTKPATEKAPTQEKTNGLLKFKPSTSVPTTTAGQSVLSGGSTSFGSGPIPGEGLFGSRPSTPNNVDSPTPGGSIFGDLGKAPTLASPENDHTWKRGAGVKFGTPEKDGPSFNVTAATPPAKDESTMKPFSNSFGASTSKSASGGLNVGFAFGRPSASPLLTPSGASSAISSRATSPGGTDTESVNTDNAEDHSNDPQASLVASRAGEENEEVLFEARTKGSKWFTAEGAAQKKLPPGWNTQGLGPMRVLKHKETGKTRVLLRADPGSNIVINAGLIQSVAYTQKKNNVDFAVYTEKGVERWFLKVKTEEQAKELSSILEANKKS